MPLPPPLPPVNPYAAPAARVVDVVEDAENELADRGTRLAAAIIDGLLFVIAAVAMAALVPMMIARQGQSGSTFAIVSFAFLAVFLALIITNLIWLHRYGQTIAKRMFRIKIVRTDGSRCGLLRVIFLRSVPITVLTYIVAFLLIAFGPYGGYLVTLVDSLLIFRGDYRCLHDHFADTIVVKA